MEKSNKRYVLQCLECGREYEDDGFRLSCDSVHKPSLLRTRYKIQNFKLHPENPGMFLYSDYLPVNRFLEVEGKPITYKSEGLASYLGLKNLYITFNGYWPERGAFMETASFKELEAPAVLGRIPKPSDGTIVVASAGNTGRAFANICSEQGIPCILVIPEASLKAIWSIRPFNDCVRLIAVNGGSDYYDAITLAEKITHINGFFPEGGVKNVARRDGMATVILSAALEMERLPDHYFQAIGSGAGAIAAWEGYLRLRIDNRFENRGKMKLHVSQNIPFTPMVDAWEKGLRELPVLDEDKSKEQIACIDAKVLSNRQPPYSIRGGIYDILNESDGYVYSVSNAESRYAQELFEYYEGIDICEAAGVTVGSLIQSIAKKRVRNTDFIVINITGGGESRIKQENRLYYCKPWATFSADEIHRNTFKWRFESTRELI